MYGIGESVKTEADQQTSLHGVLCMTGFQHALFQYSFISVQQRSSVTVLDEDQEHLSIFEREAPRLWDGPLGVLQSETLGGPKHYIRATLTLVR